MFVIPQNAFKVPVINAATNVKFKWNLKISKKADCVFRKFDSSNNVSLPDNHLRGCS